MANTPPSSLFWKVFHYLDKFRNYALSWKVVLFYNRANIHCESLFAHAITVTLKSLPSLRFLS
jgi:hypothetical protein